MHRQAVISFRGSDLGKEVNAPKVSITLVGEGSPAGGNLMVEGDSVEIRKPSGYARVSESDVLQLARVMVSKHIEACSPTDVTTIYLAWQVGALGFVLRQIAEVLERNPASTRFGETEVEGND